MTATKTIEARVTELRKQADTIEAEHGVFIIISIGRYVPTCPTVDVTAFNANRGLVLSKAYLEESNEVIMQQVMDSLSPWL